MLAFLSVIQADNQPSPNRAKQIELLERLHRQYGRLIFDLSARILGDRIEAEDAVQETFINAFRGLSSFRYGDDHLNWLYRIGTNTCLSMIRKRNRKQAFPEGGMDDQVDRTTTQEQKIGAKQIIRQLSSELDERGQEILAAHFFAGMDQGEVAEMLGISRRAVVKRVASIRKKFDNYNYRQGIDHA